MLFYIRCLLERMRVITGSTKGFDILNRNSREKYKIKIPQTMKINIYLNLLLMSPGSRYQVDFFLWCRHFNILNAESSYLTHTSHIGSTVQSRFLEL